ncbi:MAG: hypothetical protein IIX60_04685 [Clostridia bacterium]|nr:hypothetical protein [Clostridia bacterium]
MIFKIFNIEFQISVPFAVMFAFLLVTDKTGLMSASLLAVVLHEIGHLLWMKKCHTAPKTVKMSLGGVLMVGNAFCTAKESISIALAGPIVNFLFTVVFYFLGVYFDNVLVVAFGVVQFLVGAINLLPVKGLDGGTVLRVLTLKYCKRNADLLVKLVSFCISVAILVLGIAVTVKNTSNPSLLLLGIYLIILNISRKGFYE